MPRRLNPFIYSTKKKLQASGSGVLPRVLLYLLAFMLVCMAGCHSHLVHDHRMIPDAPMMPREMAKVALPEYIIEPPDILKIDTIHAVPKAPYRLETLDVLDIQVSGALPDSPISGKYAVEPGGIVNLGVPYGQVKVSGNSLPEARAAISEHLTSLLREPEVSVALVELAASQQLIGEYIVGPDGRVTLGSYGSVKIVGSTVSEAKAKIEAYLSEFLDAPVISLDVFAYNSKAYYVVIQGGGLGDTVFRMPITGNETVLDAVAHINGFDQVSATQKMWVARPNHESNSPQLMPVNWNAITQLADTRTNYQLMPGDRLFVAEDHRVRYDSELAKILAPIERAMGFSILGAGSVTRLSGPVLKGGGNTNTRF